MKSDSKQKILWLSKNEFNVISSSVAIFSQEMHWALNSQKDKILFKKEFKENFFFSLSELDLIMCELSELEFNIKCVDRPEICLFFSEQSQKKQTIIYRALKECSKNFGEYDISIMRGSDAIQELDSVLNEFKEKAMS